MTTIGTTSRPVKTLTQQSEEDTLSRLNPSPIHFLSDKLDKYPYLILKPDSLLATAVIQQYQQASTAETTRPEWPEDVCGYIDDTIRRRDLIFTPEQREIDEGNIPDSRYKQDAQITQDNTRSISLPGTKPYDEAAASTSIEDLYSVDWGGYFVSQSLPTLGSLTEEQLAAVTAPYADKIASIKSAIASAGAGVGIFTDVSGVLGKVIKAGNDIVGSVTGAIDDVVGSGDVGDIIEDALNPVSKAKGIVDDISDVIGSIF